MGDHYCGDTMVSRALSILLCGVLVALALATQEHAMEEVTMLSEEGKVTESARGDTLKPDEEDQLDKVNTVKDLKKLIFEKENEVQKSELAKEDEEDGGAEMAIGDTLKEMEAKEAVEEELDSEIKVDCEVGEWGKFGACSKLCDGGVMTRSRTVMRQPRNGGQQCEPLNNEIECNTESCASEAYQRRATRRKLTKAEKKREHMRNAQRIALAMRSNSVYDMMKRTKEVMRKVVHTEVAEVQLPGETGERSAEEQVRKSLKEAMAKNAVDNAMKTYQATLDNSEPSQEEKDKAVFKGATRKPVGKPPQEEPEEEEAPTH